MASGKEHMGEDGQSIFSKKQVKLAVSALLAYTEDQKTKSTKKDQLFAGDDYLWMVIGFRKIPQIDPKPRKIPIPHTIHSEDEICLISKEPGKVLAEKLEQKGVTNIKKVISLSKLRKNYKTFALKRELASSYDVFLCDERIYHLASKTMGKEFFKKKKEPLPIRLTYADWKVEIDKTINSTLFRMGYGPCSAVKIGCLGSHNEKELIENTLHAIKVCVKKIPGTWKNVKSIYIKSSTSVSLPVYQASPLADVKIDEITDEEPVPKKRKRKPTQQPIETEEEADVTVAADEKKEEDEDDEVILNVEKLKTDTVAKPVVKKKKSKLVKEVETDQGTKKKTVAKPKRKSKAKV